MLVTYKHSLLHTNHAITFQKYLGLGEGRLDFRRHNYLISFRGCQTVGHRSTVKETEWVSSSGLKWSCVQCTGPSFDKLSGNNENPKKSKCSIFNSWSWNIHQTLHKIAAIVFSPQPKTRAVDGPRRPTGGFLVLHT